MFNFDEKNLFNKPYDGFYPNGKEKRFTFSEEVNATYLEMKNTIDRLLRFEDRMRNEFEDMMKHITSDNVLFKQTFSDSYSTFLREVKNEINLFESNVNNSIMLFQKDIEANYSELAENVNNAVAENLKTFQAQLAKYEETLNNTYNTFRDAIENRLTQYNSNYTQSFNDFCTSINNKIVKAESDLQKAYTQFTTDINNSINSFKNEWSKNIEERLDEQDSKIIDAEFYFKTNLTTSVSDKLSEMEASGELTEIIENEVFTDFSNKLTNLEGIAINVKKYGAVGNGSTDDTVAIRTALNENTHIYIPSGTYKVSFTENDGTYPCAFIVPSNRIITLAPDAVLTSDGYNDVRYCFFRLLEVENITIQGGSIIGERDTHIGTSGEWGMGISLSSAKNVHIKDMYIANCWGDGICLGTINNDPERICRDIHIDNVICDNNRRQGISVCGVDGFFLTNSTLKNTNGTAPQAGIDFEPNVAGIPQKRMFISNLYTQNNRGYGILICTKQDIELSIDNWIDEGTSSYNATLNNYPLHISTQAVYKNGFININNVLIKNPPQIAINYSHLAESFPVTINNITFENMGKYRSDHLGGSAILFVGQTNNDGTGAENNGVVGNLTIKGIKIYNPDVENRDYILLMNNYEATTTAIKDVTIEVDEIRGVISPWLKGMEKSENFRIKDNTEKIGYMDTVWNWNTAENISIRYSVPTNSGVDRTFTISDNLPVGVPIEIINNNPLNYGILLDCALPVLHYLTDNINNYLKVKPICGAKVLICRYDANNFYIVSGHEFLESVQKGD